MGINYTKYKLLSIGGNYNLWWIWGSWIDLNNPLLSLNLSQFIISNSLYLFLYYFFK